MNILDKIHQWFMGHENDVQGPPLPNQGQEYYSSQTAPVDVQAQETPRDIRPIPVDVAGIVPVWSMPSKHQIVKRSAQGKTTPQDLFDGDYKFKRVTLWISFAVNSQSTGVFVGTPEDLQQASTSGGSIWGAELPLYFPITIEGITKKLSFVQTQASITANGALQVNYVAERWAD